MQRHRNASYLAPVDFLVVQQDIQIMDRTIFLAIGLLASVSSAHAEEQPSHPARKAQPLKQASAKKACRRKNFYYIKDDQGHQQMAPSLTDGAEYVWRNGQCTVVGGLPYKPDRH